MIRRTMFNVAMLCLGTTLVTDAASGSMHVVADLARPTQDARRHVERSEAAEERGAGACAELAGLIGTHIVVRLVPDAPPGTLQSFIGALEQNNPGLTATHLDVIANRPIHLLHVEVPPEWGPVEMHVFKDSLVTDYTTYLVWGELLYDSEAPEGKTGSTFLDRPIGYAAFQSQLATQTIGLPTAHTRSTGLGTVVAVLDTGIDSLHPFHAGNIAPGGYNFVHGNADTSDVGDGIDSDGDGMIDEMTGHGTFVAGLIRLVAPDVKLLPIRVLDSDGNGNLWWMAQGMFHAIDRGVHVINISVASTYKSEAVEDAVKEAKHLGIVVVAAAGNCDQDSPREFPAMQSHVFGTVSVDDQDIKADFSNYHDKVFISAPGTMFLDAQGEPDQDRSIVSTLPGGAVAGGNFGYWEGTSMSTPLVAGAVALIRAQHPEWPANEATYDLIEGILEISSVDIDGLNPDYKEQLGVGRIDAAAAVLMGPMQPALGDLNNDGVVDVTDLLALLGDWGQTHTSADLNGDGTVDVSDLLILLGNWG